MRRFVLAPILTVALLLGALVGPVGAITGGQSDGDGHPFGALLLAPGWSFCSGALISAETILTAAHCTDFFADLIAADEIDSVLVSFDPQASVDSDTWEPNGGTWYSASEVLTHPGYVDAEWPFTYDYGLVYLDEALVGHPTASLPTAGALDPIIDGNGQTEQRFKDVGYGIQGNIFGGGKPQRAITWERKIAVQRYAPGNGSTTALLHETWFIVNNQPSPKHGGACGGDSGSPVMFDGTDTIVAVHTGGYRLGYNGVLCGRMTSLNHRIDLPHVLDWITDNTR